MATSIWFHYHNIKYFGTTKVLIFTGLFLGWVMSGDVELFHWLKAILFDARGG